MSDPDLAANGAVESDDEDNTEFGRDTGRDEEEDEGVQAEDEPTEEMYSGDEGLDQQRQVTPIVSTENIKATQSESDDVYVYYYKDGIEQFIVARVGEEVILPVVHTFEAGSYKYRFKDLKWKFAKIEEEVYHSNKKVTEKMNEAYRIEGLVKKGHVFYVPG